MSLTIQEQIAQFVPAMLAEQSEPAEVAATGAAEVFCTDTRVLAYTDAKGVTRNISPEGAIVKGGKQIRAALWAAAEESAIRKAAAGKYRASADIISAGFPKIAKMAEQYTRRAPWANKESFSTVVNTVATSYIDPEKKQSEKMILALRMAKHIRRDVLKIVDERTIEG